MAERVRLSDAHVVRPDGIRTATTILLVESQPLVRLGLKSICESLETGPVQILEATSLHQGLVSYEKHHARIDLVILDLHLPDSKGLLALQSFKLRFSRARLVALSSAVDAFVLEEARMLGAERVIQKTAGVGEITFAIRSSLHNEAFVPANPQSGKELASIPRGLGLSRREIQILDLVLQGQSNREIVETTQLKMGTVKNYVSGLFVVFGVSSRSKLISLFR